MFSFFPHLLLLPLLDDLRLLPDLVLQDPGRASSVGVGRVGGGAAAAEGQGRRGGGGVFRAWDKMAFIAVL